MCEFFHSFQWYIIYIKTPNNSWYWSSRDVHLQCHPWYPKKYLDTWITVWMLSLVPVLIQYPWNLYRDARMCEKYIIKYVQEGYYGQFIFYNILCTVMYVLCKHPAYIVIHKWKAELDNMLIKLGKEKFRVEWIFFFLMDHSVPWQYEVTVGRNAQNGSIGCGCSHWRVVGRDRCLIALEWGAIGGEKVHIQRPRTL